LCPELWAQPFFYLEPMHLLASFLLVLIQQVEPEQGPTNLRFGGGVSQDTFHPAVLGLVLLAGILICVLPRNKAVIPFIATVLLIPTDQVLLIGHFHFPMLRVLILFGLARLFFTKMSEKSEILSGGVNKVDITILLCAIVVAIDAGLLWNSSGALIYQAGELLSIFGSYCMIRFFIRDGDDVTRVIRTFCYICAVIAVIMVVEQVTHRNPIYTAFGGARADLYATVMQRDGKLRATASFVHPILAGTFGAVLVPLFIGLWWKEKSGRGIAILGLIAATVITLTSNSSTPVLAYAAGLLGLALWPIRRGMRIVRWAIVITIVSLHMVMKAPVWHLISRMDVLNASSGYHRYQLVNQFILHFRDWYAFGVKDTSVWGWDMWDTANQYVATGENSGLIPFILFVAVIVFAFKLVGDARVVADKDGDKTRELFLWALGATLFANVLGFFGISYEDQTFVPWYAILSIVSVSSQAVVSAVVKEPEPERPHQPWLRHAMAHGTKKKPTPAFAPLERKTAPRRP
jgi:hypothetical protein